MADATITIGPIDVDLLREQRDHLLSLIWGKPNGDFSTPDPAVIDGLINLLDSMLDQAEGN